MRYELLIESFQTNFSGTPFENNSYSKKFYTKLNWEALYAILNNLNIVYDNFLVEWLNSGVVDKDVVAIYTKKNNRIKVSLAAMES